MEKTLQIPILVCLLLLAALGTAFAQENEAVTSAESQDSIQPVGPQPKIVVPEQNFDFGFSPEGFYLVHPFVIKNEGEANLLIERLRTTCGCTSAPLKKSELAPGEETEATVIFNSTRYKYQTSKGTIINSNDLINRSIRVTIVANMDTIGLPFKIEPFGLDIKQGEKPPKTMVFTVQNKSNNNFKLEIVDYTADVIQKPKIKETELKPGKKTTIEVELRPDYDYAANHIKASFTVDATGENPSRFTIPIMGSGPK